MHLQSGIKFTIWLLLREPFLLYRPTTVNYVCSFMQKIYTVPLHKQLLKLHLRIAEMVSNLPQKRWNSTNDCPNPCINRVYLLQWRIHKCVQNKIRSCKPSCQAISLHKPCQFFACLVPVSAFYLLHSLVNFKSRIYIYRMQRESKNLPG
jgi:hypothetical protein